MCITKLLDLADGLFSVSGPRISELLCTNPDRPLVAVEASGRGASGAKASVTGRHSSARAIAGAILTDIQPRLAQECVPHCEIFGLSHPTAIATGSLDLKGQPQAVSGSFGSYTHDHTSTRPAPHREGPGKTVCYFLAHDPEVALASDKMIHAGSPADRFR